MLLPNNMEQELKHKIEEVSESQPLITFPQCIAYVNDIPKCTDIIELHLKMNGVKQFCIQTFIQWSGFQGIIPFLIHQLSQAITTELQLASLCMLIHCSKGPFDYIEIVIECGAIAILIDLVDSKIICLQQKSLELLALIFKYIPRESAIQTQIVINKLKTIIENQMQLNVQILQYFQQLSNITFQNSKYNLFQCVRIYANLIMRDNVSDEILTVSLEYLQEATSNQFVEYVYNLLIELNIVPKLINLFTFPNLAIQSSCIKIVGQFTIGDDKLTDYVLVHNLIPQIQVILQSGVIQLQKDACWTISNIVAGNQEQLRSIIYNQQLQEQIFSLMTVQNDSLLKQISYILLNSTCAIELADIQQLVNLGFLRFIKQLLESVKDLETIGVLLESLLNILNRGKELPKNLCSISPNQYLIKFKELKTQDLMKSIKQIKELQQILKKFKDSKLDIF